MGHSTHCPLLQLPNCHLSNHSINNIGKEYQQSLISLIRLYAAENCKFWLCQQPISERMRNFNQPLPKYNQHDNIIEVDVGYFWWPLEHAFFLLCKSHKATINVIWCYKFQTIPKLELRTQQ